MLMRNGFLTNGYKALPNDKEFDEDTLNTNDIELSDINNVKHIDEEFECPSQQWENINKLITEQELMENPPKITLARQELINAYLTRNGRVETLRLQVAKVIFRQEVEKFLIQSVKAVAIREDILLGSAVWLY